MMNCIRVRLAAALLACLILVATPRSTATEDAAALKTHARQLIVDLKAKVTADGPFTADRYAKLASCLTALDGSRPDDRDLVADVQDFVNGKTRPAVFSAYVDDAVTRHAVPGGEAAADPAALRDLSRRYRTGHGVTQDVPKSDAVLRQAADKGNLAAIMELSARYKMGSTGIKRDPTEAVRWAQRAADRDDASGLLSLGLAAEQGTGMAKDPAAANRYFAKGYEAAVAKADQDPRVAHSLAWCYLYGRGVPRSVEKAEPLFRRAADAGFAQSMEYLGGLRRGQFGGPVDFAQAMQWLLKAVDADDVEAMLAVGSMYERGEGVPKDFAKAIAWYRRAADAGNLEGMNLLATVYEDGEAGAKDPAAALEWYRKSADCGNALAMYNVGAAYNAGKVVPRDPAKAATWILLSADAGNLVAMQVMAKWYEVGYGVPLDATAAARYAKMAAAAEPVDLAKADEWAASYAAADFITPGDFLQSVGAVRVNVRPNAEMGEVLTATQLDRVASDAVREVGIRVDPDAAFTLTVTPLLHFTDLKRTTVGGVNDGQEKTQRTTNMLTYVSVGTATPVRRGKEFVKAMVYPIATFRADAAAGGRTDSEAISGRLRDELKTALTDYLAARDPETAESSATWKRAAWPASANAATYTAYTVAARGPVTDRVFQGVGSVAPPDINFLGSAGEYVSKERLQRQWQSDLRNAGFDIDAFSPVMIEHDVWTFKNEHTFARELAMDFFIPIADYCCNANIIRVSQTNVVFELNGKLRRKQCAIRYDTDLLVELMRDNANSFGNTVTHSISAVAREAHAER